MRSTAVTLFASVCLLVILAGSVHAQTDYRNTSTGKLSVGAGFQLGASMILDPPEGEKVKPVFAFRVGADATYPINAAVGVLLGLGYDSRGFRLHQFSDPDAFVDTKINYFYITPGMKFSSFTISVNFGVPLGGSSSFPNGTSIDLPDNPKINFLVEPRLGVLVPLLDDSMGWLGLTLGIGYSISPVLDFPSSGSYDYHMVSGHMGLTYQFGISRTGR